ncbi:DUF6531 domain-containing protein [Nonomuraea jiangxiensis]|uniref:RHS repeat-associated core domain-containing protein n=1 Tax=Nonomuraea jiangxiensis TaxID=633440 RepID=A0A1G9N9L1_9ACTN|nr:DUF6531 domain-containing protein [Nonomuraea jiangxiensis]SDL83202.1 RHS repeat-associated core domain-containing protein [Nonomuraea jiangxiensis]
MSMPLGQPVPTLRYESSAGDPQPVCELRAADSLQATCLSGFQPAAGTFAMWLSTTSATGTETLFSYTSPERAGVGPLTVRNAGNVEVRLGSVTTGPTGVVVNDGAWHRVAVTYEVAGPAGHFAVCVYLDENLVFRSPAGLATARRPMAGGDFAVGGGLAGRVSEVQVWDRALTADAVRTGQFRRAVPGTDGLVVHWPLDVPPPGNPSAAITTSPLRFRSGRLTATWAAVAGAPAGYHVRLGATDGSWDEPGDTTDLSYTTTANPVPAPVGVTVAAYSDAGTGAWSNPVEIKAFEPQIPDVRLTWDAAAGQLAARWADLAQRASFTLELYEGDAETPVSVADVRALTYDLTGRLDQDTTTRLDVRTFALGSLGPAQPRYAAPAPTALAARYRLADGTLTCSWSPPAGADGLRLVVTPRGGGARHAATLAAGADHLDLARTDYPLTAGTVYDVRVRAFGGGTIGPWAAVAVAPHDVAVPVLAWTYTPGADTLAATWQPVPAGAVYEVRLLQGGTEVVGRTSLEPRYDVTSLLGDAKAYKVLVAAVEDGVVGPENVPVTPVPLTPVLRHLVETHTIEVSWAAEQPEAYVRLSKAGTVFNAQRSVTGGVSVAAPAAGFPDGTNVTCAIRALTPGFLGAVETASLTVQQLATPVPVLECTVPATRSPRAVLTARWPAVNPGLTVLYQVRVTVDGTPGAVTDATGLSADVSGQLGAPGAIGVSVRATTPGNVGAWSAAPAVAAPTGLTLAYDEDSGRLDAGWTATGAEHCYLEMTVAGDDEPTYREWLDGTAGRKQLALDAATARRGVTVRVRSVQGAALSPFTTATTTLAPVPGPVLQPLTDTLSPERKIGVTWDFDAAQAGPGTLLGFTVTLTGPGGTVNTRPIDDPEARGTEFADSGLAINTTYTARVRARVRRPDGTVQSGAWSQPAGITFGVGRLGLSSLTATSNNEGDLTVNWSMAQPVTGATFTIRVGSIYTRQDVRGTGDTLLASVTEVVRGTEYEVGVRAVVPANGSGPVVGEERTCKVTAGKPELPAVPDTPHHGDPVNVATGSYGYANTDLLVPGPVPLAFQVTYRSDSALPDDEYPLPSTPMGARWNHNHNTRIRRSSDGKLVAVIWGDLSVVTYDVPASVTGRQPERGVPTGSTLYVAADLTYTLTTRDQSVYSFDRAGALRSVTDPAGNVTRLEYTDGLLTRVSEPSGHWLRLDYHPDGRVAHVTADTGANVSYDYAGADLTTFTDPLDGTRRFRYDGRSRMTEMIDATGATLAENTYTDGRVTFQRDARAVAAGENWGTTFAYVTSGTTTTTTITDREGQVTTHVLDVATQLPVEQTVRLGPNLVRRTRFAHDGNGRLRRRAVTEGPPQALPAEDVWTYDYDGAGNLVTVTDPLGGVERGVFDARNRPVERTDRLGNTTRYAYDGPSLATITDPLGQVYHVTYRPGPPNGLVETVTDFCGVVTRYDYDDHDRLRTVTDPTGSTEYGYDRWGWAETITRRDPAGTVARVERRENDAMGRRLRRRVTYAGQPEPEAFAYEYEYDDEGRLTRLTNAVHDITRFQLGRSGLVDLVTLANGDTLTPRYDREERRRSLDFGAGVVELASYDALGRVLTTTSPLGHVTRRDRAFAATAAGSRFTLTLTLPEPGPDRRTPLSRQVVTDALGRTVARVDEAGGETTYRYEHVALPGAGTGLKVTTVLPRTGPGQAVPWTRSVTTDPLGRVVERVNERGKRTTWAYAPASTVRDPGAAALAVTVTRPGGGAEVRLLDCAGRLVELRRGQDAEARTVRIGYDALGRTTTVTTSGADGLRSTTTSTYGYADGRITVAIDTDGAGGPVLAYDGEGRLVTCTGPAGRTETYGYAPGGAIATYRNGRGQVVTHGYDRAGRLTDLAPPDGPPVRHVLDLDGNRTSTEVGGTAQITREFDKLGRLTKRTVDGRAVGYTYAALGGVATLDYPLQSPGTQVTYHYDGLGRLATVTDWSGRTTTYGYHPTGEPAQIDAPGGVRTSTELDDDGRLGRLSTWLGPALLTRADYAYNACDEVVDVREILTAVPERDPATRHLTYDRGRLARADGVPAAYDDDGNMTTVPGLAGPLAYDVFGAPVAFAGRTAAYDADGLRTRIDGVTHRNDAVGYVDPWREQADPVRAITRRPDAMAGADRLLISEGTSPVRYVHGLGLIGSEAADGTFTTYVFDGQGSTVALVRNGAVVARHAYDLHGRRAGGDPLDQPFGYAGRFGVMTDAPELLNMRARAYAPATGGFTGQDFLLGRPVSGVATNRYAYALGDPLLRGDPLGLDPSSSWGPVVFGVIVAGGIAVVGGLTLYFGSTAGAAVPAVDTAIELSRFTASSSEGGGLLEESGEAELSEGEASGEETSSEGEQNPAEGESAGPRPQTYLGRSFRSSSPTSLIREEVEYAGRTLVRRSGPGIQRGTPSPVGWENG